MLKGTPEDFSRHNILRIEIMKPATHVNAEIAGLIWCSKYRFHYTLDVLQFNQKGGTADGCCSDMYKMWPTGSV